MRRVIAPLLVTLMVTASARGEGVALVVELPEGTEVASAVATATELKLDSEGVADGRVVRFENLLPDTPYSVKVTLADGVVLQGVDLAWHNEEPAVEGAGEMTDEDWEQVQAILDVPRFYNKCEILQLGGDHDRATALVQLVRDKEFYGDKGGEIVWRIELWYFKNQFGGWEAIKQQNKVLRRERFRSREAFDKEAGGIRWVAELGGIRLSADEGTRTVTVSKEAIDGAREGESTEGDDAPESESDAPATPRQSEGNPGPPKE